MNRTKQQAAAMRICLDNNITWTDIPTHLTHLKEARLRCTTLRTRMLDAIEMGALLTMLALTKESAEALNVVDALLELKDLTVLTH